MRLTAMMLAGALALTMPTFAVAGHGDFRDHLRQHRNQIRDRVEDRIDRRENRIDERVDHGPRDVIEDFWDRWEDRRDRAGLPVPPGMNSWERYSWLRLWCQSHEHQACRAVESAE